MNILMLLPGLFLVLQKFIGPLLGSQTQNIISKLTGGGFDGTVGSIMKVLQDVLGNFQEKERTEIEAELQTLLGQIQINMEYAKKDSFFLSGARPFLFWGLSIIVLYHCAIVELFNTLISLGYDVGYIAPMDTYTWLMMGGLCGIWMVGRTVEKINSNQE